MRNLALRFLQSQDIEEILWEYPEVEDTPQIEEIMDLKVLESLIRKLPDGYQKVFRLAVLEDKTHKEIAKLLGIDPHTSMSQLFHAKLMMRRLVTDYKKQAGILMMILILGAGRTMLLRDHVARRDARPPQIAAGIGRTVLHGGTPAAALSHSLATAPGSTPSLTLTSGMPGVLARNNENPDPFSASPGDTVPGPSRDLGLVTDARTDSVAAAGDGPRNADSGPLQEEYTIFLSDAIPEKGLQVRNRVHRDWTVSVSLDGGLFQNLTVGKNTLMTGGTVGDSTGNGDEPEEPGGPSDLGKNDWVDLVNGSLPYRMNGKSTRDYKSMAHTNHLPVAISFAVNKPLSPTLGLESGLTYSYLNSTFEDTGFKSNCHWHYLGIPLKLNVLAFTFKSLDIYASAGGRMDIPLYSKSEVTNTLNNGGIESGRFSSPVVWSLSGNIGLSFRLTEKAALFIEPTLHYHFSHRVNVPNIWSDNRWSFSLPIGFRFICK